MFLLIGMLFSSAHWLILSLFLAVILSIILDVKPRYCFILIHIVFSDNTLTELENLQSTPSEKCTEKHVI